MATLEQLAEGIRRADAAGDADAVRQLGQAYRAMQQSGGGQPARSAPGMGETFGRAAAQGFTFGLNDEMRAAEAASGIIPEKVRERQILANPITAAIGGARAMGSAFFPGVFGDEPAQTYARALAAERERMRAGADENPITSIVGNIAGGAVQPLNYLGGAALQAGQKFLPSVVQGAKAAAPIAAAYGFGEGEGGVGNRLGNAAITTAIGAPIAGVLGAGVNAATGAIANRVAARDAAQQADTVARRQFDEFGVTPFRPDITRQGDDFAKADSISRGGSGPDAQRVATEALDLRARQIAEANRRATLDVSADPATGVPTGLVYDNPTQAAEALGDSIQQRTAATRLAQEAADRDATDIIARTSEQMRIGMAGQGRDIARDDIEVGQSVIDRTRAAAGEAKQGVRSAYDDAMSRDGEFSRPFISGIGTRVKERLTFANDPVEVGPGLPSANSALALLEDTSNFMAPRNRADPRGMPKPDEIVGINMRGVEAVRKRLQALYRQTNDPSDKRAMSRIIASYDDELEEAMTSGLFVGDDTALDALRSARSAYRNYAQTFGVRKPGDDAGANIRKILERDAQPAEVANFLYGSARMGQAGSAVRTAERLKTILGPDSDEWLAVRQGAWQRLIQAPRDVVDAKAANAIADRIEGFTRGNGRILAGKMFDTAEIGAMTKFASHLRAFANRKDTTPEAMKTLMAIADKNISPADLASRLARQASPGAGTENRRLALAVRDIYGESSPEMSAVRQLVWSQLTERTEGVTQRGAQALTSRINEFLKGTGRPTAEIIYSPEQLAMMQRYANMLERTVPPPRTTNPSGSGDRALGGMIPRMAQMLATSMGAASGGLEGGAMGFVGAQMWQQFVNARNAKFARKVFSGDNPALNKGIGERMLKVGRIGASAGMAGTPAASAQRERAIEQLP